MHPNAEPLTGQKCSAKIPSLDNLTRCPARDLAPTAHDGIFLLQHFLSAPVVEQE